MNKKLVIILSILTLIIISVFSFNDNEKPSYSPIMMYNSSGVIAREGMKMFCDSITPSTSNGYSINISAAGFTNVYSVQVIALRNTASATASPQVSIKSVSTSAIVVNITEANTSLVNILGSNVLLGDGLVFAGNVSGIRLWVQVIGK